MMVECVIDETDPFYDRLKHSPMQYNDNNMSLSLSTPRRKSTSFLPSPSKNPLSLSSTKREKSSKSNEIVVVVEKIVEQQPSSQSKVYHKKFNSITSKKAGVIAEGIFTVEGDEQVKFSSVFFYFFYFIFY